MPYLDITKPELVWPGKYDANGQRVMNRGAALPFQVVETICEGRATRQSGSLGDLFSHAQRLNDTENWHNKLIWGDNLLVMASLLKDFAGKIDLIYIDPPFATGADFTFVAKVGETEEGLEKESSAIEEKAYRDTWGRGTASYLDMMHGRLSLVFDLLSPAGCVYLHCDWRVSGLLRLMLDELFGPECFMNEIVWERTNAHNMPTKTYVRAQDTVLFYAKGTDFTFNPQHLPYGEAQLGRYKADETGRLYTGRDLTFSTVSPNRQFEWRGTRPPRTAHGAIPWRHLRRSGPKDGSSSSRTGLRDWMDSKSTWTKPRANP
jgi:hypothetical protein